MKIFQILGGFCHWDATDTVVTLERCAAMFSADMVFAEAPDYVFEGWGYDAAAVGDDRFIRPSPPDGWLYDENSGTFYPADAYPPGREPDVWDEMAAAYAEGVNEA